MKGISKIIDPLFVIGLIFSIALALFLVFIGQDEVTSLMIGLITTLITLAIDIVARLKESEERILKATTLGDILLKYDSLHSKLKQIAEKYLAIRKNLIDLNLSNFDLFIQKSEDALLNCIKSLSDLEKGELEEVRGGTYTYGKRGINEAKIEVKATSFDNIEFWEKPYSKEKLIEANAEAIKRGVKIIRIFIIGKRSIKKAYDILKIQRDIGVNVGILFLEQFKLLHSNYESYQIVDDKILVEFYNSKLDRLEFESEKIYIHPEKVKDAIYNFNKLFRKAQDNIELLNNLKL